MTIGTGGAAPLLMQPTQEHIVPESARVVSTLEVRELTQLSSVSMICHRRLPKYAHEQL